jgi:hypothetical protein
VGLLRVQSGPRRRPSVLWVQCIIGAKSDRGMAEQYRQLVLGMANLRKKLDLEELLVGVNSVLPERHQVAGAAALEIAAVKAATDAHTLRLMTRPIMSQSTPYRQPP